MLKTVRGTICASLVSGVIGLTGAVAAQAETLHDALVGAYNHSGLLDQNRALLRAADEDVAQAVAALRPIVNWAASLTHSNTNSNQSRNAVNNVSSFGLNASVSLTAQMLIWDGGRSKLGIEAAKETVLATRQSLVSIEQQVFIGAVSAYFNVRRQTEEVALRQNNVRLITQELRAAEDRFEVGEVTRTDVAQAQARLAEARSGLASAQGALVQAQEAYANVVGRKPGRLAAPGRLPGLETSIKHAKTLAVRNHPDLRQVQHQVAAAELTVQQVERARLPTVTLEGSLTKRDTVNTRQYSESTSLGLNLSGPVYRGGALDSQTRAAIAARDAQLGNLHRVRHVIRENVGVAYATLQVAQAQLISAQEQIRAARVAFRGVREEATLGARTTLDVLDAEQSLLQAQASAISAQADSYIAAYQVLQAMGRLTVTDLKLGIRQYDPNAYYNLVKDAPTKRSKQGEKLDRVLKSLQRN